MGHESLGYYWDLFTDGFSELGKKENWENSWNVAKTALPEGVETFTVYQIGQENYNALTDNQFNQNDFEAVAILFINFELSRGGGRLGKRAGNTVVNGNKYWNRTTEFKDVKVYQRNDIIDPNLVDGRGRTNLQRMEKGLAPIGPDGNPINLHHMTQRNESSIAEVTQSFHQQNSSVIHINPNTVPSGINRNEFNKWKQDYWKNRANDFK